MSRHEFYSRFNIKIFIFILLQYYFSITQEESFYHLENLIPSSHSENSLLILNVFPLATNQQYLNIFYIPIRR